MFHVEQIPQHVQVMAVTKGRTLEEIKLVLEHHNVKLIGESRWQEAKTKLPHLPKEIAKHFIGHVQTNKLKEIMANFDCIESVDSIKLLEKIDALAEALHVKYPIFLQINISSDPNKYGFTVDELPKIVEQCQKMFHVELLGLMAITAKQTIDQSRKDFKQLKQLQQTYQLKELSMGMSTDYNVAIEEGATIIRIGKALFN